MTKPVRRIRLLMIGPLPPPIGGATVVFKNLVDDLRADSRVEVEVFNLSRDMEQDNLIQQLRAVISLLTTVIRQGQEFDVISFHANLRGRIYIGPPLYLLTRLLRRPIIMRTFGGAFADQYQALSALHRWLMRHTYFNAEICLFQTKRMTEFFEELPIRRAEWFSNYTYDVGLTVETPYKISCSKLVFLGRITTTKGIEIILDTAPKLPEDVTVDLYGPLDESYSATEFTERGAGRVRYGGVLSKIEIQSRLWDYDALILPTFHDGEGYPGVILEAYAHGLPVITTQWMSIPEIVEHEVSGLLIEPQDIDGFVSAVNRLFADDALYHRLQEGAREKSKQFSSDFWTEKYIRFCYEAANEFWPDKD